MNYLAHAYLSFNDPEILTGNMISDFVKGKKKFDYPSRILAGIELHRMIDQFTDSHEATASIKSFFRSHYGLYSGAFADIVYDHFLASDPLHFPDSGVEEFAQQVYERLAPYANIFPANFAKMFPYMQSQNWLANYRFTWGIERSMQGLVHRAKYISDSNPAFDIFLQHYEAIKTAYQSFFPDLYRFSKQAFNNFPSLQ